MHRYTFLSLFACCYIMPTIGFIIASYVVGGQNVDISCDNSSPVKLSSWLFTYASVVIVQIIVNILGVIYYYMSGDGEEQSVGTVAKVISYVIITLGLIFTVIWILLGIIILFVYSLNCFGTAQSIAIMVSLVMVYQLVYIIINIYIVVKIKHAK